MANTEQDNGGSGLDRLREELGDYLTRRVGDLAERAGDKLIDVTDQLTDVAQNGGSLSKVVSALLGGDSPSRPRSPGRRSTSRTASWGRPRTRSAAGMGANQATRRSPTSSRSSMSGCRCVPPTTTGRSTRSSAASPRAYGVSRRPTRRPVTGRSKSVRRREVGKRLSRSRCPTNASSGRPKAPRDRPGVWSVSMNWHPDRPGLFWSSSTTPPGSHHRSAPVPSSELSVDGNGTVHVQLPGAG